LIVGFGSYIEQILVITCIVIDNLRTHSLTINKPAMTKHNDASPEFAKPPDFFLAFGFAGANGDPSIVGTGSKPSNKLPRESRLNVRLPYTAAGPPEWRVTDPTTMSKAPSSPFLVNVAVTSFPLILKTGGDVGVGIWKSN
jgi:hypothetical protein